MHTKENIELAEYQILRDVSIDVRKKAEWRVRLADRIKVWDEFDTQVNKIRVLFAGIYDK